MKSTCPRTLVVTHLPLAAPPLNPKRTLLIICLAATIGTRVPVGCFFAREREPRPLAGGAAGAAAAPCFTPVATNCRLHTALRRSPPDASASAVASSLARAKPCAAATACSTLDVAAVVAGLSSRLAALRPSSASAMSCALVGRRAQDY